MQQTFSARLNLVPFNTSIYDKAIADSGSGVDQASIVILVSVSDTGSGVDAQTVPEVSFTVTDAKQTAHHYGMFGMRLFNAPLQHSDPQSSEESVAIAVSVPLSDSGSGTESLVITVVLAVSDAGVGSDYIIARAWIVDMYGNLLREQTITSRLHREEQIEGTLRRERTITGRSHI